MHTPASKHRNVAHISNRVCCLSQPSRCHPAGVTALFKRSGKIFHAAAPLQYAEDAGGPEYDDRATSWSASFGTAVSRSRLGDWPPEQPGKAGPITALFSAGLRKL